MNFDQTRHIPKTIPAAQMEVQLAKDIPEAATPVPKPEGLVLVVRAEPQLLMRKCESSSRITDN